MICQSIFVFRVQKVGYKNECELFSCFRSLFVVKIKQVSLYDY